MNRSSIVVAAFAGAAALSFVQFAAAAPTQTRIDYSAAMDRASVVYKDARAKCDSLAGHGKDMCVIEAKAGEKRAKAVAEAQYQGTLKAATASRIADADADLMVAKVAIAKCDALAGPEKEACTSSAKSAYGN